MMFLAPAASRISVARAMPCSIMALVFSLNRIVDLGGRNPMAIRERRVERHTVVLLRQVLAGHARQQTPVHQRAIGTVMVLAPGQTAGAEIGERFIDGAGSPSELKGVATHKAARR